MKNELIPDWVFKDISQITPKWLKEQRIRGVFSDLDNTLAHYSQVKPPDNIIRWRKDLAGAGIYLAVISNNKKERVQRFCENLDIRSAAKAEKPKPAALLNLALELGLKPGEVLMVGDQVFTDVRAGKRAGMLTAVVEPLSGNIFFRLRRFFEQPFINRCSNAVSARGTHNFI